MPVRAGRQGNDDFVLFGLTLVGVALCHRRTLEVALTDLAHEWVILANLLGLLLGFALLSNHFERAAIVAASNAGGAGSVVGDTTTTMMWIDGVSPSWCSTRMSRQA